MPQQKPETSAFLTNPSLLSRLRNPDDAAGWERFILTYGSLMHGYALRRGLGDAEAQDAVQEACIDVARQMPGFRYDRARGRFKNWLLTIVAGHVGKVLRARDYKFHGETMPRAGVLSDALAGALPGADDFEQMWDEEWKRHLSDSASARVREKVPAQQWELFPLHVIEGLTADEAAARSGASKGAVYWAKQQVGNALKAALAEIENAG